MLRDPYDYDLRLPELGREYKTACEEVQVKWKELLKALAGSSDRQAAVSAYTRARESAQEARRKLLEFASGGVWEVGQ
jgi:hypothetical protein